MIYRFFHIVAVTLEHSLKRIVKSHTLRFIVSCHFGYEHNCYNGIGTWFYQALGGLRTAYDAAIGGSLEASAGYRRVVIEPQVPAGVEWCSLTKQSPYGEITVDWRLTDGEMTIEVGLPVGVEGQVAIPQTAKQVRLNKREVTAIESVSVVSGRSVVSYKL